MRVSDYIANFLADYGIKHIFMVVGGYSMYLNDSIGKEERLECIFNHHEQASAMAAEGYARVSNSLAVVCVTAGPGSVNALNGVLGNYVDSVPVLYISGNVKRDISARNTDLRQMGDQEVDIISIVSPITKYAAYVDNPGQIAFCLKEAIFQALSERRGPVWLDIPLDVQKTEMTTASEVLAMIKEAKNPLILAGSAVRKDIELFHKLVDKLGVRVATAWNAPDILESNHPLFAGRPDTLSGAPIDCDFLMVLGSRLNIRQIGWETPFFVDIMVDIDQAELDKHTLGVKTKIRADIVDFMGELYEQL